MGGGCCVAVHKYFFNVSVSADRTIFSRHLETPLPSVSVCQMATSDERHRASITSATDAFSQFAQRCVAINDAYVVKHGELERVFSGLRHAFSQLVRLRSQYDANQRKVMMALQRTLHHMSLDQDDLCRMEIEQNQIMRNTALVEHRLGRLTRNYSDVMQRPPLIQLLSVGLTRQLTAFTEDAVTRVVQQFQANSDRVVALATTPRQSFQRALSAAVSALPERVTSQQLRDMQIAWSTTHAAEATHILDMMMTHYSAAQRLMPALLGSDVMPNASHILSMPQFQFAVPHALAAYSYDSRPTLRGTPTTTFWLDVNPTAGSGEITLATLIEQPHMEHRMVFLLRDRIAHDRGTHLMARLRQRTAAVTDEKDDDASRWQPHQIEWVDEGADGFGRILIPTPLTYAWLPVHNSDAYFLHPSTIHVLPAPMSTILQVLRDVAAFEVAMLSSTIPVGRDGAGRQEEVAGHPRRALTRLDPLVRWVYDRSTWAPHGVDLAHHGDDETSIDRDLDFLEHHRHHTTYPSARIVPTIYAMYATVTLCVKNVLATYHHQQESSTAPTLTAAEMQKIFPSITALLARL